MVKQALVNGFKEQGVLVYSEHELNTLYRYCLYYSKQEIDAFDLLQTALEICVRKPPRNRACRMSYIRTVIRHRAIDTFRKVQPILVDDETLALVECEQNFLDELVVRDELEYWWDQLDLLDKGILSMLAIDAMSYEQIAEELQIAKGTLFSRVARLRKKMIAIRSDELSRYLK